jgi:hypothetical protein
VSLSVQKSRVKVQFMLRPTVIRAVCPDIRPPSATRYQYPFLAHGYHLQKFAVSV